MNMCSVRHSRCPSRRDRALFRASSGLSALPHTSSRLSHRPSREIRRATPALRRRRNQPSSPNTTFPVVPSIVIQSPSFSTVVPMRRGLRAEVDPHLFEAAHARQAHAARDDRGVRGRAAFAVSTPLAAIIPCTSSGASRCARGSRLCPALCHSAAVSASNTTCPVAAPGDAFRPLPAFVVFLRRDRCARKTAARACAGRPARSPPPCRSSLRARNRARS